MVKYKDLKTTNTKITLTSVQICWILILFLALAAAADKFFCPTLSIIANVLKMSPDVAISFS